MKPIERKAIALGVAALSMAALVDCSRDPIEETQRRWLADQHVVEKRMAEVRVHHLQAQRTAKAIATLPADVRDQLRESDSALAGIESMFDKHSLERQASIDAGDIERMKRSHATAQVDYATAGTALSRIEQRNAQLSAILDAADGQQNTSRPEKATQQRAD